MATPGPDRQKILRQQQMLFMQSQRAREGTGGSFYAGGEQAGRQENRAKRTGGRGGSAKFVFCRVCRRNHGEGRRHLHSAAHKARLETLLLKFLARVRQAVTFQEASLPLPPAPPETKSEGAQIPFASPSSTDGAHCSEDSHAHPVLIGPSPPEAPPFPGTPPVRITNSASAALEFLQLNDPSKRTPAQAPSRAHPLRAPTAPGAADLRPMHPQRPPGGHVAGAQLTPLHPQGQPAASAAGPSFGRSAPRFGVTASLNSACKPTPLTGGSAAPGLREGLSAGRQEQACRNLRGNRSLEHSLPLKPAIPQQDEGTLRTPSQIHGEHASTSLGKGWWCPFCENEVGCLQRGSNQEGAQPNAEQAMEAHMALMVHHIAAKEHAEKVSCFWGECVGSNAADQASEHLHQRSFVLEPGACSDWAKRNPRSWGQAFKDGRNAGLHESSAGPGPDRPAAGDDAAMLMLSSVEQRSTIDQRVTHGAEMSPFPTPGERGQSAVPAPMQVSLLKPWETASNALHTGHDRTEQGATGLAVIGNLPARQLASIPPPPVAHLAGAEAAGGASSTQGGARGEATEGEGGSAGPGPLLGVPGAQPDLEDIPVLILGKIRGQKKNPKRVGAAWAEQRIQEVARRAQGLSTVSGLSAALSTCDIRPPISSKEGSHKGAATGGHGQVVGAVGGGSGEAGTRLWLPNFGGVWQSGPRHETLREFEAEQCKHEGSRLGRAPGKTATGPVAAVAVAKKKANTDADVGPVANVAADGSLGQSELPEWGQASDFGAPLSDGPNGVSRVKDELNNFVFTPYVSKRRKRQIEPGTTGLAAQTGESSLNN